MSLLVFWCLLLYSLFPFLIFLIWVFSPGLLLYLAKDLPILMIFSKSNSLFHWLFILFVLFLSILLISSCSLIISFHLLLGIIFSLLFFSSRAFSYAMKLLVWDHSIFFLQAFLWTCPLEWPSLCPICFSMLNIHFL